METSRSPGSAVAARAAVQRAGHVSAAETNRERLRYDEELIRILELHSWAPEAWEIFAEWIAGYGYNVIKGWLFTRKIYTEMAQISRPVPRCPDDWLEEYQVHALATDTVAAAIAEFKTILQRNQWDAARGASLRTYFVGQCKRQFANIYRSWHKARTDEAGLRPDLAMHESTVEGPEAAVIADQVAQQYLNKMPEQVAAVFQLHVEGYSHAEIAERTGLKDAKAVENVIGRERKKWNAETRDRSRSGRT